MGHSSINVSLTYLGGLEIAKLKEVDMPMVQFPDGPIYFDDPKANIGQNIRGNNINPTVYPSLFPKLFEVRFTAQIKKTKFKYGTQNNNNQYQGFPMIFSQTSVEYIGIIEAHPGSFALLYKNQKDNTGKKITIKINRI